MKKVFEASNGVEAHMVLHMLESHGIEGRIEGEHLSGGIGELPAMGLVRVLVNDEDVERARAIIADWEKRQPGDTPAPLPRRALTAGVFLLGAVAGAAFTLWLSYSPPQPYEVDHDSDGRADEVAKYRDGRLESVETDRNFDGRVDSILQFDASGRIVRLRSDDDFDGTLEIAATFRRNQPVSLVTNRPRSARTDYRLSFVHGVMNTIEIVDIDTGDVVRRQYYDGGVQLLREEVDLDRDGALETLRTFDPYQNVVSTTRR